MSSPALINRDFAGGLIVGQLQTTVFVESLPVAVIGDNVLSHSGHSGVTMIQGSPDVFIEGKSVCRNGDLASCSHPAISNNSVNID